MNLPLATYILFHSSCKDGLKYYTEIYKLLCRDADRPFTDGIDIPVYMRTGTDEDHSSIPEIDISSSEKTLILLLVDDYMYCSRKWSNYISYIRKLHEDNELKVSIQCIALCNNAFDLDEELGKRQFISLPSCDLLEEQSWKEFQIRVFDAIIRFLQDDVEEYKLKLFISHSKKDKDRYGEQIAKELRDYIRSKTKLDSFFDANDIIDGISFGDQIKDNAEKKRTTLIVIYTDSYSEREWCQKEILFAKAAMRPIIVVSALRGTTTRAFPYIANIPHILYAGDWSEVLILALRTTLDQLYQTRYLSMLQASLSEKEQSEFNVLPFAPEAYSYTYGELSKNIIYPEPPLFKDELDGLSKINKATEPKLFLTPMQLLASEINLSGKTVGISVSESPEANSIGYGEIMFKDFIVEVSRHLLVAGAEMVYGGDLRAQGFTHLFKELSFQYGEYQQNKDRHTKYFTNYFAWPIHLNLTIQQRSQFERSRVGIVEIDAPDDYTGDKSIFLRPTDNESNLVWAKSLNKMRNKMESHVNARIILGGKLSGFKGYMAGLLEEFYIAQAMEHPVYIVGGFGGAARLIASMLLGEKTVDDAIDIARQNETYHEFTNYCASKKLSMGYDMLQMATAKGIDGLHNGLTPEDNNILFRSTNIIEIISLILKGLNYRSQQ